jgi:hypothetical protein
MGNGASTRPATEAVPGSVTSSEECHVISIDAQQHSGLASDGESSASADLVNLDYSNGLSPVPSSRGSGRRDVTTNERKPTASLSSGAAVAAGSQATAEVALSAAAQSDHDEHDDDAQEASNTYNAGDMSVESINNSPRDANSVSSNAEAELTPRVESLIAPMLALSPSPPHSLRTGGDFDLHEASFDSHCGLGAAAQLHPQPFDSSGSDAVSDSRSTVKEQQQQQQSHWPARGRRLVRQPQSAAAGATAASVGSTVFIEPAIVEERATDLNDTGSSSIAASIAAAAASIASVSPPPASEAGRAALEMRNLALERQVAQLKNQLAGQMESLSFSLDTAAALHNSSSSAAHNNSSSINSSSTSQRGRDRSNSRSKGKASGALARVNSRFNSSLSGERGGSRGRPSPPRNSSAAAKTQHSSSNGSKSRSNSPPPPLPVLQRPPSHHGPASQLERNSSSSSCIAQARRVNTSPPGSSSAGRATNAATAAAASSIKTATAGVGSSSTTSGVAVPMLRAVQGLQKKPRGNRSCAVIAPLDSSSSGSGLHSSSAIDVTAGRKGAHSALPSSSSSVAHGRAAASSNGTAAAATGSHSDANSGSLTSRSRGRRGVGDAPAQSLWDSADTITATSNRTTAAAATDGGTAGTAAATQRSAAHTTSNSNGGSSSGAAKRSESADFLQDSSESLTGPVSGTKHTRRGGKRRDNASTTAAAATGHGGSIDSLSQPRAAAVSSTVTPAKPYLQQSHPDAHSTVATAVAALTTPAGRSSTIHPTNNSSSSFSTGENIWADSLAAVGTGGGESHSSTAAEDAFFGNGCFDSERGWGSQLSSRWAEVEFMLRHAVETDADLTYTAGAAEAGLIFMDHLEAKAQQLGVRKGQLSRWLLPYDLETSVAEQRARTPGTARFAMPQDIAAQISDREVSEHSECTHCRCCYA